MSPSYVARTVIFEIKFMTKHEKKIKATNGAAALLIPSVALLLDEEYTVTASRSMNWPALSDWSDERINWCC